MRKPRGGLIPFSLALSVLLCTAVSAETEIALKLHPRCNAPDTRWPLTFGVPIPKGELKAADAVKLLGPGGKKVPCQVAVTARWLDDSVQWLLVDFVADLPATPTAYKLVYGPRVKRRARPRVAVKAGRRSDELSCDMVLDAGVLRAVIAGDRMCTFRKLILREGTNLFGEGRTADLFLMDEERTVYVGSRDTKPTITVEESGPIRATVKLEGWTVSKNGRKLGKHVLRIQAFAGVPCLRVYHTWIVTADSDKVRYRNVSWRLPFRGASCEFIEAKGAEANVAKPTYLLQYTEHDSDLVINGAAAKTAGRCLGRVRVGEPGYAVYVKDFWQNFPKELEVAPGELRVHIWPAHGKPRSHVGKKLTIKNVGRLWFAHEGEVLDFFIPQEIVDRFQYGSREDNVLLGRWSNAMGVARTHEFWIDVSPRGTGVPPYARCFQARPVMVVDPKWIASSGVFGRIAARDNGIYKEIEQMNERVLDWIAQMRDPVGDYGMWNYGDYHQTYMPTLDYAGLHRHWVALHHGGPRWPWITYARTGEPRFLDFAEANARHLMDVDTCHYTTKAFNKAQIAKIDAIIAKYPEGWTPPKGSKLPKRSKLLRHWKRKHMTKQVGAFCFYKGLVHWFSGRYLNHNSMADWLLWDYYMTGDRRGLDVAMEFAGILKRTKGLKNGRAGMGFGDSRLTMYLATREKVFQEDMHKQMAHFLKKGKKGSLRDIYYSPFVERYYDLTQDAKLKEYIIAWADARVAGNSPWSSRDTWYNLMAYAYHFTSDPKYLRCGLAQLRALLDTRQGTNNPRLDGVAPCSLPGNISYTFQQWPLFLKALREYEKKAGKPMPIPRSGVTPFRFTYATYVRSSEIPKGKKRADLKKKMAFYLRKAPGEEIDLPLRFRLSKPGEFRITDPNGKAIVQTRLEAEVRGRRRTMAVGHHLKLAADAPAGDYRIELAMPYGRYFDTVLPWRGKYRKLVADARQLMRMGNGSRFYFMPRLPAGKKKGRIKLKFGCNPKKYYLVSRLWGPDGKLRDIQGQPPRECLHEVRFGPEDAGRLWVHTRGFGPNAYADLSGDILPVISFTRESFFVPREFEGK